MFPLSDLQKRKFEALANDKRPKLMPAVYGLPVPVVVGNPIGFARMFRSAHWGATVEAGNSPCGPCAPLSKEAAVWLEALKANAKKIKRPTDVLR
jgi:hypothetical protein